MKVLFFLFIVVSSACVAKAEEARDVKKLGEELRSILENSSGIQRRVYGPAVTGAYVCLGERELVASFIRSQGEDEAEDLLVVALEVHLRVTVDANVDWLFMIVDTEELRSIAGKRVAASLARERFYRQSLALAESATIASDREEILDIIAERAVANGDDQIAIEALKSSLPVTEIHRRLTEIRSHVVVRATDECVRGLPGTWRGIIYRELLNYPSVTPPKCFSRSDQYFSEGDGKPRSMIARWVCWGLLASSLKDKKEVRRALTAIMEYESISFKDWCDALPIAAYFYTILEEESAITKLAFGGIGFENAGNCGARRTSSAILAALLATKRIDDAITVFNTHKLDVLAEDTFAEFGAKMMGETEFLAATRRISSNESRLVVVALGVIAYSVQNQQSPSESRGEDGP